MRQVHIIIKGKVQGVFFRHNTKRKAEELELKGFVKNCDDGSVEIVAEGQEDTLNDLIAWCNHGSEGASVVEKDVDFREATEEFNTFEIRH
jgi:acylphosphatase